MRVMRRRASFIGAAMPERIECIDDRSPHRQPSALHSARGNPVGPHQDQNIGYVTEYLTAIGIDWRGS